MIRFLVRTGVMVAANAVGLIVAAVVLDGVRIDAAGFIVAVVIFTVAFAVMTPFLANQFRKGRSSSALGGVALIATLVSLVITDVVSSGLTISGTWTWIEATVIVWLAALLAAWLIPLLGLKRYMERDR